MSDLFISEVVEGSSNNKAIEIYNGTGAAIDLAAGGYSIQMFFNGSATAGLTINLTGTVAAGDVFVLAQSSAAAAILVQADQTNGAGWFNGDDAIVLRKGTTVLDVVGQIGVDPGTEWGTGLASTADNTIQRKSSVTGGDVDGGNAFDPAVEWNGFAVDTFSGLGSHDGGGPPPSTPTVTVAATDNSATEGSDPGFSFTFTRSGGDQTQPLTVTYSVAGTASAADYSPAASGTVTFLANQSTAVVSFSAVDDPDVEPSETVQVTLVDGAAYDLGATATATATIVSDDAAQVKIHDVQGAGAASGMQGQTVIIEAIVTGDFQNGDGDAARSLGGFFVQEETADWDTNSATSEGVFIFGGATDVHLGDRVRITGTVSEFNGLTEITASNVQVVQAGAVADVKTLAVDISLPSANLESVEGMLVRVPQTLVATDLSELERLGETKLYASEGDGLAGAVDEAPDGRPYTFTQTNDPSVAGYNAYTSAVDARTIIYDDGLNGTWQGITNPAGGTFTTATAIQSGDSVTGLVGVLDYGFNAYRVRSVEDGSNTFTDTNPANPAPPTVGGTLTVASFNVLNFFVTLNNGSLVDNGQTPRGANTEAEFARQVEKLVGTIITLDADVLALVELENDFSKPNADLLDDGPIAAAEAYRAEGNAIGYLVEKLNAALGDDIYAWVDPGLNHVGTDAISTGFIYKKDVVQIAAGTTVAVDLNPVNDRPTIAVSFQETATGADFTAVSNHFKSKGSGSGANADPGDGAGASNADRVAQATRLDSWLDSHPTGSTDADVVLLGDFNSYYQEAPIDVLRAAGFEIPFGQEDYSYVFDGQVGTLDYAFVSASLSAQVAGTGHWHINADEADALDYNISVQGAPGAYSRPAGIFDGGVPYRVSDHDIEVIGLNLNVAPIAKPDIASVAEDASVTIDVLANDTDLNVGDTKTLVSVSATATGSSVAIVGGKVVYTANADAFDLLATGQTATDTFSYVMKDRQGVTSTSSVTVTVTAIDDAAKQVGGNGADTLTGTATEDLIDGGNGADKVLAGGGHDTVTGGNGADKLYGEGGSDSLSGDNGADLLDGGAGDDTLSGGLGGDTFVFAGAFGSDRVADFDNADVIQLDLATFHTFANVLNLASQDGADVVISLDAAHVIRLAGVQLASLNAGDFVFV